MYYDYYLKGDYERALEFRRLHPDQQAIHAYIEYIPIYGQLGRKQEALENWRKLLADVPGASAETFEAWYHLWNMRDEDIAKLMDGVYKSGVLGVGGEARPVTPVVLATVEYECPLWVISGHTDKSAPCPLYPQ